jgi:hypothetical protein
MAEFKDASGRKWKVQIWLSTVSLVRTKHNVVLTEAFDENGQFLPKLKDYETLAGVIATVCQEVMRRVDPTEKFDEQAFMDGMTGAAWNDAARALVEAIADFTQPPEGAKTIKEMMARQAELQEYAMGEARANIASMMAKAREEVTQKMRGTAPMTAASRLANGGQGSGSGNPQNESTLTVTPSNAPEPAASSLGISP